MMKQPKIEELKIDTVGTTHLRKRLAKVRKIKITINLDADILGQIRNLSQKDGIPYQSYLNRLLRTALSKKGSEDSRLRQLEKEVERIKKQIAA